jgi:hypothetical protein
MSQYGTLKISCLSGYFKDGEGPLGVKKLTDTVFSL